MGVQISFRWNLQTATIKNTIIHVSSTPIKSPVENHEGFGNTPAPELDWIGPILILINEEYTEIGLKRLRP